MHIWQIPDDNNEKFDYLKAVGNNFEKVDEGFGEAVAKFTEPLSYKGEVTNISDLPSEATNGDIYNVTSENKNYIWNGTAWVEYSSTLDLSYLEDATKGYQTTTIARELEITDSAGVNGKLSIEEGNTEQEQIAEVVGTTVNGEGIVNANNVDTTKEHRITPIGNTHQDNYTGKNLFDYVSHLVPSVDGLTSKINEDGSITTTGQLTKTLTFITQSYYITNILEDGETYTISQTEGNVECRLIIQLQKQDDTLSYLELNDGTSSINFTVDKTTYKNYAIFIQAKNQSYWNSPTKSVTYKYMLAKGTDTTFEKYVGGTASPNPDYPQKVNNVGSNVNLYSGTDLEVAQSTTGFDVSAEPNKTYTISYKKSRISGVTIGNQTVYDFQTIRFYNSNDEILSQITGTTYVLASGNEINMSKTFVTPSNTAYVKFFLSNNNGDNNVNTLVSKIKIEQGNKTGYTPYNRGGIDVKVENKNLVDASSFKAGYIDGSGNFTSATNNATFNYDNPINVKPSTKYYFSANTSMTGLIIVEYNKNNQFITRQSINNVSGNTFTTGNNTYYIILFVNYNGQALTQSIIDGLQLQFELGESRTTYIAHAEQNITIPLPEGMELCKIGDYSDKIFHNIPSNPMYNASLTEDGWYKYKVINKVILKETNQWFKHGNTTNNIHTYYCASSDVPYNVGDRFSASAYSNYFYYVAGCWGVSDKKAGQMSNEQNYSFYFNSAETTMEAFKTWLSTHNITLYYILKEAGRTYTQITDTDSVTALNTMESFALYEGVTNVYLESGIDGNIELKYNYVTPAPTPARASDINNVGSILPNGYQQVEYIESSGTQWIDTGFVVTNKSSIEADIQFINRGTDQFDNNRIFGTTDFTNKKSLCLNFEGNLSSNDLYIWNGLGYNRGETTYKISTLTADFLNNKHKYILDNTGLTIDNTLYAKTGGGDNGTTTIKVFTYDIDGSVASSCKMKLYHFKIYDNTILVRDLIPCYRINDNTIGLYDVVNNVFYSNAGTGTFTKGKNVGIDVKVCNKNILDTSSVKTVKNENGADRNGYYVKIPKTGTYYIYINTVTDDVYYGKSINLASNTTQMGSATHGNTSTREYTFNAGEYFIIWGANNPSANDKIMLAYGNETSYTAHQEQDITIPLPEGMKLCKTNNYSDKIFHNIPSNPMYNASLVDGGWYKYNVIKEFNFTDGSFSFIAGNSGANFSQFNIQFSTNLNNSVSSNTGLCSHFSYYEGASNPTKTQSGFRLHTKNLLVISIPTHIVGTSSQVSNFRTWCTNNNVKYYAPLETPTYTQITDTDTLEALYQMEHILMYQKYTYIQCTNEIKPKIKAEYLFDNEINNSFGSIIDALEERVHALESEASI